MAKIDVTIPDELFGILKELAEDGGQSLSSVAADCIKLGLLDYVEARNKLEVNRKLRRQRLDAEAQSGDAPKPRNRRNQKNQRNKDEKNADN